MSETPRCRKQRSTNSTPADGNRAARNTSSHSNPHRSWQRRFEHQSATTFIHLFHRCPRVLSRTRNTSIQIEVDIAKSTHRLERRDTTSQTSRRSHRELSGCRGANFVRPSRVTESSWRELLRRRVSLASGVPRRLVPSSDPRFFQLRNFLVLAEQVRLGRAMRRHSCEGRLGLLMSCTSQGNLPSTRITQRGRHLHERARNANVEHPTPGPALFAASALMHG